MPTRHQHGARRTMKGPEIGVCPRQRSPSPGVQIFWKPRVISRCKPPAATKRNLSSRPPQGAFSRDVQGLGCCLLNQTLEFRWPCQGQTNLRIPRTRNCCKHAWLNDLSMHPQTAKLLHGALQGANNAIDLRSPRICDDQNPAQVRRAAHACSPVARHKTDTANAPASIRRYWSPQGPTSFRPSLHRCNTKCH